MSGEKKEIEIGRASKNAQKCLLAASDNAWFDYPILSREHAKFTISVPKRVRLPSLLERHRYLTQPKAIYVSDCGSTHGTYLQKKKLDRGTEYVVNNGEVITFGQCVTSGAGI